MFAQLVKRCRRLYDVVCVAGVVSTALTIPVHAQATKVPTNADGLRYLSSVGIAVSVAGRGRANGLLDSTSLRSLVELELRRAGVTLTSNPNPEGRLTLMIGILPTENNSGQLNGFVWAIHAGLKRGVMVAGQPAVAGTLPPMNIAIGETWQTSLSMGAEGSSSELSAAIRQKLVDIATVFANDYLSAKSGQ